MLYYILYTVYHTIRSAPGVRRIGGGLVARAPRSPVLFVCIIFVLSVAYYVI